MNERLPRNIILTLLFLICSGGSAATEPVIRYVASADIGADVIVDSRPSARCREASLPAARCLPADDFFGPHHRLANASGILWLLGTAGLTGSEHVLVIGDESTSRDLLAGLLFLAGQERVSVLNLPLSAQNEAGVRLTPGVPRSRTREVVYRAPMRGERILLRNELRVLMAEDAPPVILDGRTENEYWGQLIRAARGGHLPGAQHFPSSGLLQDAADVVSGPFYDREPVVYGHDAFEGVIYMARLTAHGIDARLYLEGWAGWASDGGLPADSVTYPDHRVVAGHQHSQGDRSDFGLPILMGAGIGAALLAFAGFLSGRLVRQPGNA